jgi:hypothetical protein
LRWIGDLMRFTKARSGGLCSLASYFVPSLPSVFWEASLRRADRDWRKRGIGQVEGTVRLFKASLGEDVTGWVGATGGAAGQQKLESKWLTLTGLVAEYPPRVDFSINRQGSGLHRSSFARDPPSYSISRSALPKLATIARCTPLTPPNCWSVLTFYTYSRRPATP